MEKQLLPNLFTTIKEEDTLIRPCGFVKEEEKPPQSTVEWTEELAAAKWKKHVTDREVGYLSMQKTVVESDQ